MGIQFLCKKTMKAFVVFALIGMALSQGVVNWNCCMTMSGTNQMWNVSQSACPDAGRNLQAVVMEDAYCPKKITNRRLQAMVPLCHEWGTSRRLAWSRRTQAMVQFFCPVDTATNMQCFKVKKAKGSACPAPM